MIRGMMLTAATILVTIVVLTPATGTSAVRPDTILTAPYAGTTFNSRIFMDVVSGCSAVGFTTAPYFHALSGLSGMALNASSPACSNRVGKVHASATDFVNRISGG